MARFFGAKAPKNRAQKSSPPLGAGLGVGKTILPDYFLNKRGKENTLPARFEGRRPQTAPQKSSPPLGAGLGVGVSAHKPNAAIKRHGRKMSDYAPWQYSSHS